MVDIGTAEIFQPHVYSLPSCSIEHTVKGKLDPETSDLLLHRECHPCAKCTQLHSSDIL